MSLAESFGLRPVAAPRIENPQLPFQVMGEGFSVFESPAGVYTTPAGHSAYAGHHVPSVSPAFPSRSVEISETGRGNPVHASVACSSNFQGLAQRLTFILDHPSQQNMYEAIDVLDNCLNERVINSNRFGGMNPAHRTVFELVRRLKQFIFDYYSEYGQVGDSLGIQYTGTVNGGFVANLQRAIRTNGGIIDQFQIRPDATVPIRYGGKRKATRKAGRKARKTRHKRK